MSADVYQATLDVCDRPDPQSEYEGKFSIYHCIAAALSDGLVEFSSFSKESRDRLSSLRGKVAVQVCEPYKSAYPDKYWGAAVSATTMAGETLTEIRNNCRGDPEAALSEEDMFAKAEMLFMHGGLTQSESQALIQAIMGLARDELNWDQLKTVFL